MNYGKRVIAVLLTAVCLIGVLPLAVCAEDSSLTFRWKQASKIKFPFASAEIMTPSLIVYHPYEVDIGAQIISGESIEMIGVVAHHDSVNADTGLHVKLYQFVAQLDNFDVRLLIIGNEFTREFFSTEYTNSSDTFVIGYNYVYMESGTNTVIKVETFADAPEEYISIPLTYRDNTDYLTLVNDVMFETIQYNGNALVTDMKNMWGEIIKNLPQWFHFETNGVAGFGGSGALFGLLVSILSVAVILAILTLINNIMRR